MQGLAQFQYAYTHGPIDTKEEFLRGFATGDCRRALQDFILKRYGRFLAPAQIYIPESYDSFGSFGIREGEPFATKALAAGDIIYAQKRRSKSDRPLSMGPDMFDSRDEWLFSLHNAVYMGALSDELSALLPEGTSFEPQVPYVWHASVVADGTVLWDWDTFTHYYAPVSAKRFV